MTDFTLQLRRQDMANSASAKHDWPIKQPKMRTEHAPLAKALLFKRRSGEVHREVVECVGKVYLVLRAQVLVPHLKEWLAKVASRTDKPHRHFPSAPRT